MAPFYLTNTIFAAIDYSVAEHSEKLFYLLKLIFPISLLMLCFFILGLWMAHLFRAGFEKRFRRSRKEKATILERMSSLIDDQNELLGSIESRFDNERQNWITKVEDRDNELEIRSTSLAESESISANRQTALDEKAAELLAADERFEATVSEKNLEIESLETEISRAGSLRKELAEKATTMTELRNELKTNANVRGQLDQLEEILALREAEIKELREKMELRA